MSMFQISEAAETALRRIREESDVPPDAAVRIGRIKDTDGLPGIGFAFTDGPEDGDQTISSATDFPVYLADDLAIRLSEAALQMTSNAEGITLQLQTREQLNGPGAPRLAGSL
jgi:hypothetical protein